MTFYFKPPRGDIPLHKLEECLQERISYLHFVKKSVDISESCEHFKFEYLTDGSALDRTGHFMLRLIALKLNGLKEFLIDSESILFEKRLRCLQHSQIDREIRTAHRHVKEILLYCHLLPKYQIFLQNFTKLCEEMIHSRGVSHTFTKNHSKTCKKFILQVPFTFCLSLIVTRDVDLAAGQAIIPCGKWAQLLSCVFAKHLEHGMQQLSASKSYPWDDERVKYLLRVLKTQLDRHHFNILTNASNISAKDIDQIYSFFPPCMRHFHKILRQRHRLSHYSRFYYSLFLKDIGMPLLESIQFWSQEYALANANCTSCSHSWQKDSKKYIYSIRHMYGLEGSRHAYSSPHCQQLQKMSFSPSSDGGCPFLNFDDEKLKNCLHSQVKFDQLTVKSSIGANTEENAKAACKAYFEELQNLRAKKIATAKENEEVVFEKYSTDLFSPLQFYNNIIQTSTRQSDRNIL